MVDETFPPELEKQKELLMAARDDFRRQGYQAFINAAALKVQDTVGDVSDKIRHQERIMRNSYASARKMDELLKALPE